MVSPLRRSYQAARAGVAIAGFALYATAGCTPTITTENEGSHDGEHKVQVRNFTPFPHLVAEIRDPAGTPSLFAALKITYDVMSGGEVEVSKEQRSVSPVTTVGRSECADQVTRVSDALPPRAALTISVLGPALRPSGGRKIRLSSGGKRAVLGIMNGCYREQPGSPPLVLPLPSNGVQLETEEIFSSGTLRLSLGSEFHPFLLVRERDRGKRYVPLVLDTVVLEPHRRTVATTYHGNVGRTAEVATIEVRLITAHDLDPTFAYPGSDEPPDVRVARAHAVLERLAAAPPPSPPTAPPTPDTHPP